MEPAVRVDGSRRARVAAVALLKAASHEPGRLDESKARALLARTEPDVLLPLAAYHRVGGILYEALRQLVEPDHPVVAALGAQYAAAVRGHMRVIWELAQVKPALDASGARWAVIKGPALVEPLYGAPGRRPYADLDLLVDPAGFRDAVTALEDAGSRLLDRNWLVLRRDLRGEVHLVLPGGTPLDLHWNVLNMNRRRMWIETSELLERAPALDLGGLTVRTLDPTDTVLHLAVHGGTSGGDRLIWLKDIERAVALRPPSWQVLVERARGWNVAGPVGFMLARSAAILGADVPEGVTRVLLGRGSTALIQFVDRISPWELALGRLTAANLVVARGIAHGRVGGLRWMVERMVRNLDPREPEASSALTPSGGDQDRDAYFDAVVALGADSPAPRTR